jgi:hypothetical protein
MWPITFEERLAAWHSLRTSLVSVDTPTLINTINDWWFRTPMINQHLRWDKYPDWPGPWDLLAEDRWCDLARAVGIVYTIMMVAPHLTLELTIAQCEEGNLVLVEQGKYILNWAPGEILNIDSANIKILRQVDVSELQQHLG